MLLVIVNDSSFWTTLLLPIFTTQLTVSNFNFMIIVFKACVHAKSLQSCLTLCNPMDCSPLGSSIQGVLQTRILEWFAMPSSRRSSWPGNWACISLHLLHWAIGLFITSATWEALWLSLGTYIGILSNYDMIPLDYHSNFFFSLNHFCLT